MSSSFLATKRPFHELILETLSEAVRVSIEEPSIAHLMTSQVHTCVYLLGHCTLPSAHLEEICAKIARLAQFGPTKKNAYSGLLGSLWQNIDTQLRTNQVLAPRRSDVNTAGEPTTPRMSHPSSDPFDGGAY